MRRLSALYALSVLGATACAADFTVKPLMVSLSAPAGVELSFRDKPMGYEPGYRIHLMIQGEGIAEVKDDSLVIDKLAAADGRNLATGRTGKPTWKMGSFPKVTEDGKAAFVSLEGPDNLLGKADGVTIAGSVVLLLGNEVAKAATGELEAKDSKPQQMPGFTVKTGPPAGGGFSMGGGDEGVTVTVQGELGAIIEVKAAQAGKALKTSSSFGGGDWKTHQFDGDQVGKVTIEVTYWKDLKQEKVPFTVALKP